jgi:hypothetical protein
MMLDAKERSLGERQIAWEQRDWLTRTGLDWVGVATGLLFTFVAVRKAGWADALIYASGGGFLLGGSIVHLYRARASRLLAKLYREAKEREAAGR